MESNVTTSPWPSNALAGKDSAAEEESEVHGESHGPLPVPPEHGWQREDAEERIGGGMEGAGVVTDPDCSQLSTGQERLARPMSRGGPEVGREWPWPVSNLLIYWLQECLGRRCQVFHF